MCRREIKWEGAARTAPRRKIRPLKRGRTRTLESARVVELQTGQARSSPAPLLGPPLPLHQERAPPGVNTQGWPASASGGAVIPPRGWRHRSGLSPLPHLLQKMVIAPRRYHRGRGGGGGTPPPPPKDRLRGFAIPRRAGPYPQKRNLKHEGEYLLPFESPFPPLFQKH